MQAASTTSCVRPASAQQRLARLLLVARLAVDPAVQGDDGVDAEHVRAGHRARLAAGVLERDVGGVAVVELVDVGRPRPRTGSRGARGSRAAAATREASTIGSIALEAGKNSSTSRAADSGESEPWTRFWPTSRAKSPRIEPGAASSGFGGADDLARGRDGVVALEHQRDERARGDEVDELAEERLALVLGVVLLGELLARRSAALSASDRQALALEAGDDLAGQAARERVGLDQDQSVAFHGFC